VALAAEVPTAATSAQHGHDGLEQRIARGVSGSFIVSVTTAPFGYLTSLILARISPEAVGAYSIMGIYLGVVSGILYFGGGTVTIRFLPALPKERRFSFLGSYFLFTLSVVVIASVCLASYPQAIKFLIGREVDVHIALLLLWLSPLPLLFFSALAALKGLMKVTQAQSLMRATTVGACLIYAYFWLGHRDLFRQAPGHVIFISYLVLMLIISVIGLYALWKEVLPAKERWSWYLPAGFWGFTLGVQGASTLGMLHMKLDQILVLRQLNVSLLGTFFVALQIAEITVLMSMFFVEGVLPGVTNMVAARRLDKIPGLYQGVGRHMVLVMTGLTCFLLAFARPILELFGKQYTAAYPILLVLVVVNGLDALTWLNAMLISGLGKPNYWTAAQIVRIVAFVALFGWLTNRYGLLGAALARGVAWILAEIFGFYIVLKRLGVALRIPRQFYLSTAIMLSLGALQLWGLTTNLFYLALLFLVSVAVLFGFGGYHWRDLNMQVDISSAEVPARARGALQVPGVAAAEHSRAYEPKG